MENQSVSNNSDSKESGSDHTAPTNSNASHDLENYFSSDITTKKKSKSGKNSPKCSSTSSTPSPPRVGSKRDREALPCEAEENMSADDCSDDSHESNKKIRTDNENDDYIATAAASKNETTKNVQNESSFCTESNSSDKVESKNYSNKCSSTERLDESKCNKKSKDKKCEASKDITEEIRAMSCGKAESDGMDVSDACSKDQQDKNTECCTENASSKSNTKKATCASPSRRRHSRSYRSRLEESSDEEEAAANSSRGRLGRPNTPPASGQRRRSARRASGELRDSSAGRRSRPEIGSSHFRRLARFLASDSDDTDPEVADASARTREAGTEPSRDSGRRSDRLRGREHRSEGSRNRGACAAEASRNSSQAGAVAAQDADGGDEAGAAPAAAEGEAEPDSVAERVRRRRIGRGGRERRSGGGGGGGRRQSGAALLDSSSRESSPSSNSDLNDLDSDDDDDSDLNEYRSRSRRTRARQEHVEAEIKVELKAIQDKKMPKHNYNIAKEIIYRQYMGGLRVPASANALYGLHFTNRLYSSLYVIERLKLLANLEHHQGCVNAVGFSNSGDVLVSGSDDLQVALWDWSRQKMLMAFQSGHRSNVFQCKYMPIPGDRHIVTCARDGQVRLSEVAEAVCQSTRRLARHNGPSHKLAVTPARPQVVLSAGEDGEVKECDLRQDRASTIAITTNNKGSRVPLYSIHNHPLNANQFCVAGRDDYVCVYDRRITTVTAPPVLKYCPENLCSDNSRANVTCAVYSNNGDAILASYNDDDIYMFDTRGSCGDPFIHRYSGHRNSATVKGVNMFGPNSQYIVSGSDCGNVFIWNRETEAIVRCFQGDVNGVVNVLEWHPHLPLLATAGLDSDVKIWMPFGNPPEKDRSFSEIVECNLRERRNSSSSELVDFTDSPMIMMIWEHMRRLHPRRGGAGDRGSDSDSDDDNPPAVGGARGGRPLQCATQ